MNGKPQIEIQRVEYDAAGEITPSDLMVVINLIAEWIRNSEKPN
jgi:hypothetical protein